MNSKESSALVYVIIVTYNGLKWIDQCLQSLQESDYSHRVLIVDNCSTDNTVQHVKDKYPEVTFLIQDRNLGFGKANNIGLRYALTHGGEYFL